MIEAPRHGVADHIPGNQEIGGESEPVDDLQFMPDPFHCFPVLASIAIFHPIHGQFFQQHPVVLGRSCESLFILDSRKIKIYPAILYNFFCVPPDMGNFIVSTAQQIG